MKYHLQLNFAERWNQLCVSHDELQTISSNLYQNRAIYEDSAWAHSIQTVRLTQTIFVLAETGGKRAEPGGWAPLGILWQLAQVCDTGSQAMAGHSEKANRYDLMKLPRWAIAHGSKVWWN